ncbi:MAG: sigma 54-interacting transcriptional regulator [Nevskia sp.]|nr:sigma 54-interacting transcriptional regulator [Nevskia sp.]
MRRVLALYLESEGYEVTVAASGTAALEQLAGARPQFVLADLRMPGMDGIELLERVQASWPGMPVAILTAHGDIPEAVAATRAGAADFLTKPPDRQRLLECIRRHADGSAGEPSSELERVMATRNPALQAQLVTAARVARTDAAVLITGASGSGKEVLARAIHRASSRAAQPFVAINCGAMPAELLESELFGHRRGAFTGAHSDHQGLFRAAQHGTVFLDEIGDMRPELQVKLLRVLQERQVRPVGETQTVPVDVRVISATHRDLPARIAGGEFREDLYYRLNVVGLHLPALAERREDIPALVHVKLAALAAAGAPRRTYSAEAMELLVAAAWPGNVRQLFNVVEQNVALAPGRVIGAALVRQSLGGQPGALPPLHQARSEFVRNYLRQLLQLAGGNVSRAARLAGRNRTDFYKLLHRHGIDAGGSREPDADTQTFP